MHSLENTHSLLASQSRRIKKIMAAARRGKNFQTRLHLRIHLPGSFQRSSYYSPPPSNSEVISLLQRVRVKHEMTQHCMQVTVTRSERTPNWELCCWLPVSGKLCSAGRRGAEKEEKQPTGTASLFRFALIQSYFVPVH